VSLLNRTLISKENGLIYQKIAIERSLLRYYAREKQNVEIYTFDLQRVTQMGQTWIFVHGGG
jgi:hypothetical protein